MWDNTAPYFHQLADLLRAVAESHHHVTVDSTSHERWQQVMGLMREVDTVADTSHDHQFVLEELGSFDAFRARYPALSPENAPEVHAKLLQRAENILTLGRQVAQATDSTAFIRLRVREGMYTAHLFADTATPELASQANFSKFLHTLRAFGASASLLDSSVDLARDYHAQESQLLPTIAHRKKILGTATLYAAEIRRPSKHWRVMKEAAHAAQIQLTRKLTSRSRNASQRF